MNQSAEKAPMASPPRPHDCRRHLPHASAGYGSTGVAEGTVALCPVCHRAWVCLPCYQSYGPTTWWRPVRWFSRRDVRRRAASLRPAPHPMTGIDERGRRVSTPAPFDLEPPEYDVEGKP